MPYVQNSAGFLIESILGVYVLVILLRLVFQYCSADHTNPLSVMIIRLTEAPLRVFRRLFPQVFGVDMACFSFALAVTMIQLALVMGVSGHPLDVAAIAVLALSDILSTLVWIVIIAILVAAIDLSPIIAFFVLNLILRLVVAPIDDFGRFLLFN